MKTENNNEENHYLIGELIGNCYVCVTEKSFYECGYFGKGELSRSNPLFSTWFPQSNQDLLLIQHYHHLNNLNIEIIDSIYQSNNNNNDLIKKEKEEKLCEPKENLILSIYESFYLSFFIGCLKIYPYKKLNNNNNTNNPSK
jgi:hypothetical protein